MWLYNADKELISELKIIFYDEPHFKDKMCAIANSEAIYISITPAKIEKIWTFLKTEDSLIVQCNEEDVVNMVFADYVDERCREAWEQTVTYYRVPSSTDEVIDFHRLLNRGTSSCSEINHHTAFQIIYYFL